jgi:hypothetical protein
MQAWEKTKQKEEEEEEEEEEDRDKGASYQPVPPGLCRGQTLRTGRASADRRSSQSERRAEESARRVRVKNGGVKDRHSNHRQ